jgi:hypothetical protein
MKNQLSLVGALLIAMMVVGCQFAKPAVRPMKYATQPHENAEAIATAAPKTARISSGVDSSAVSAASSRIDSAVGMAVQDRTPTDQYNWTS